MPWSLLVVMAAWLSWFRSIQIRLGAPKLSILSAA